MTIQQMLYFREVANTRHFTLAAQNLYVAQSSLSHAISMLEQELGVPLFARKSGRKVQLTSYGQAFLPYAEQMLANMEQGQATIEKMRNPNSGIVSVAYSYVNGFSLIPTVFNRFYAENSFENISIRFAVNHGKTLFEQELQLGKLDLAFSCTPGYEGLTSRQIARQELVLLLPKNHPLAGSSSLSLYDVKDELFVGYHQNWNLSNWIAGMFQSCGLKQDVSEFYSDWATQIACVSMGRGLAISPRLPVDSNLISVVPLDHPDKLRPIYLHWASNRDLSPAVRYVRDYCLDYFAAHDVIA